MANTAEKSKGGFGVIRDLHDFILLSKKGGE
jgi:hypothetical protein